jgi:hypothetical protein
MLKNSNYTELVKELTSEEGKKRITAYNETRTKSIQADFADPRKFQSVQDIFT